MPKIYITRPILEDGIDLLKQKGYEVEINSDDRVLSKKELIKNAKGVGALLCLLTDKIDGEVLDGIGKQLKIVANYAVGVDNIDVKACQDRNIYVSNTPGVLDQAVAEFTFALMLAVSKHVVEADKYARSGKFKAWGPKLFLGPQLSGKTLGVIGLGRIGSLVAKMAVKGMGMKVVYNDLKPNTNFEQEFGARFMSKEELLKRSDFVSLHVPLLPATKHLIDEKDFKMMKKTAYLINTARGPVVNEKALIKALQNKEIAGAGIDVFECEPAIDCDVSDDLELKKLDNLVMVPHIASATFEARGMMSELAAKNIIAVLEGGEPLNKVVIK